jgi:hypothetical protein
MTRLATRLDRLESLVPTPLMLRVWQSILHEAATVVGLDDTTTAAFCAAVQARQVARRLPRLVPLEETNVLLQDALIEIETHLEPSQRSAFRLAASEACMAAARRYGYRSPEDGW